MGITDIVSDFITAILVGYTGALDRRKVWLSILQSKLEINDLELYKYGLFQHGYPIIINRGHIGNILITFPNPLKIFDSPTKIVVRDVTISTTCIADSDTDYPTFEEVFQVRQHQLKANELFKSTFSKYAPRKLIFANLLFDKSIFLKSAR